ncbi:MAG TPA: DUF4185 domain-containing protein [Candidatus Corynebacterium gallistercoris]|uniref:DUF4185 domain-containing protein n=1 Tax=Candidatus Corynebacterium gallistercoris TaxID=2838530 RepID=A0A9D1UPQ9_9CORY|nr:DUF4185 domain-containing protein [Candidatus Corynebacterium gallistercoris]
MELSVIVTIPSTFKRIGAITLSSALVISGTSLAYPETAKAKPCWNYRPTLPEILAANGSSESSSPSALGSLGDILPNASGSTASFIEGRPVGLPNVTGTTEAIHMVTGPDSPDQLNENGLASTDLGIMWDAGDGRTLAAFGDSFSCTGQGDGWHSNALFYTDDVNPSNGIHINGTVNGERSGEFLPTSLKIPGVEHTIIPTAGVEVGGVQYMDFMSVKEWGRPGQWTTNYAQTARSTDGGATWEVMDSTIRTNRHASRDSRLPTIPTYQAGNENFQMLAFAKPPAGAENSYVYIFGTPNGRSGSAHLARVPVTDFPNFDAAEYWTGSSWASGIANARPVFGPHVSELSVQYNDHLGAWLALYETPGGIVVRKADTPQGPWTDATTLVSKTKVPDLYGGYMYPHQVDNNLYWVATTWQSYNAALYRTDLDAVFN